MRSTRLGRRRPLLLATFVCCLAACVGLLAVGSAGTGPGRAAADPSQPLPPNWPPPSQQPESTPNWAPPNWPPPHGESPPITQDSPPAPPASSGNLGGVAGAHASGGSSRRAPTVTVAPVQTPEADAVQPKAKKAKPKAVPPPVAAPAPAPIPAPVESDSGRSSLADTLLNPTEVDLSAENLAEGGLLAFLLFALLYLPVMIFNKTTEKNHDTVRRWLARPRAWFAWFTTRLPFAGHPLGTLIAGVLASTVLFSFVEPDFPNEEGAWQYALGMLLGFTLVSTVFFVTWRFVVHWLEPEGEGRWIVYPPYILLAAFLVVMARLAHFLPGVVLGTVAEYEPARKLNRRTAGIRVANTYGALLIIGLIAWFAWIPVSDAASKEGASSLTLILDSMLAITFVSALESVAFGLIPMRFLDGNDLFVWKKPLWAAMWGGSLLWFTVVILNPALSAHEEAHARLGWLVVLFSALMAIALATWGYFRLREWRAWRKSAPAESS
jgi:hypothetical protein